MGYEDTTPPKRRLLGLTLAILFHVLLLYALTSGLGKELVQKAQKVVNVSIIEEAKPPPPPEPPAEEAQPETNRAETKRPKAFVPRVETNVKSGQSSEGITSVSADQATPVIREPVKAAPTPAPPGPPPKPKVIHGRLVPGCRLPKYPAKSLDKGEEGLVVFRFLIGADGAVNNSILVKSSGFDRLDEAALAAFKKCKFVPDSVNGAPKPSWQRYSFGWKLQ